MDMIEKEKPVKTEFSKAEKISRYDLETINEARRLLGLKEIGSLDKECLRCSRPFVSEGDHNRMCDNCRKISA